MKPKIALAETPVSDIDLKNTHTQTPSSIADSDIVEIRFGDLPGRCRIVNAIRRSLGRFVFEPGIELSLIARSCDKDVDGIPYIVVTMDRKFEYVSENDIAIDSSVLSKEERKLSVLEQRTKLMEMLNISYK